MLLQTKGEIIENKRKMHTDIKSSNFQETSVKYYLLQLWYQMYQRQSQCPILLNKLSLGMISLICVAGIKLCQEFNICVVFLQVP